jgi:tRNA(fMet)-specific endonuclease VapC
MNGYLLDTDTCVEILRGNQAVISRRRGIYQEVVTTEITARELYFGAAKSRDPAGNKQLVEEFLKTLRVMPIGRRGAQFFGAFKVQLQAAGNSIPDADLWIASISRSLRLMVITGNARHLARVPGVVTEDWIRTDA